jgi:hypothetical protein
LEVTFLDADSVPLAELSETSLESRMNLIYHVTRHSFGSVLDWAA